MLLMTLTTWHHHAVVNSSRHRTIYYTEIEDGTP